MIINRKILSPNQKTFFNLKIEKYNIIYFIKYLLFLLFLWYNFNIKF
jgi:hypothetical protein